MINNSNNMYISIIPRVSNIISFIFPFEGNGRERYEGWLKKNNINQEEYLEEANAVWTLIHNAMEEYILHSNKTVNALHQAEIDWGYRYIDQIREKYKEEDWWKYYPEYYVRSEDLLFQWTIDLLVINERLRRAVLIDWKTWWVAKKKYKLPNKYTKNYWKIKKVGWQLSYYAQVIRASGYEIESLEVVILHEKWCYNYSLPLWSRKLLYHFLKQYYIAQNSILHYNKEKMQIIIKSPIEWIAYSQVELTLNEEDLKGLDQEQRVELAVSTHNEILSKYK